jgi:molybdenum cofactor cytidylyltransferase
MSVNAQSNVVGILLAAGRATRFGGDKLLVRMDGGDLPGEPVGVVALRHLRIALPDVIAVVRPEDHALAAELGANGAHIVRCANAADGMSASLACGVRASAHARGWVVALADMPWIRSETIARVVAALERGAPLAAPFHEGQRGHPVAFSHDCYDALDALTGDEGAKAVVAARSDDVVRIDTDDSGVLRDVDSPADLR